MMTMFFAQAAAAQGVYRVKYNTSSSDQVRQFGLNVTSLIEAPTGSGTNMFDYLAVKLRTPGYDSASLTGQSAGTQYTGMIVYKDSFDPAHPEQNIFAFNGGTGDQSYSCGENGACPQVSAVWAANTDYIFVIARQSAGQTLALPISFTTQGPNGEFTWSAWTPATAATAPEAPTDLVGTAGDGSVSLAFTAPKDGGSAITDYKYQLDGGDWVSAGATSSPIVITGLTNGTTYSIKLRAVNAVGDGSASAAVTTQTGSPATELAKDQEVIQEVVTDEASRSMQATITFNDTMSRDARTRFINSRGAGGNGDAANGATANEDIAFDVDGTAEANGLTLSTRGKFFGQTGNTNARRLVFGDFDLQRDGDTGSTTLSFTGRMAWEKMTSNDTMLGYFIGGEVAQSNIKGSYAGDQRRLGVIVGGYGAHSLSDKLFVDGYVSFGLGRNNLSLSNGILALDSDYVTRTITFGGRLSGIIERNGYEIWPELSLNYGRTAIGAVGFNGKAFGLVDNTLSLDAGTVSTLNVMFRPEFRLPLDGKKAAKSLKILTFAPRIICEQIQAKTTDRNCGGGAEIGIAAHSEDGMQTVSAKILADQLGSRIQSSLQVNLEFRF